MNIPQPEVWEPTPEEKWFDLIVGSFEEWHINKFNQFKIIHQSKDHNGNE